jgi:hypothetical protein
MTLQRKYPGASNFSNWLRVQPGISSELGFVATDIDYIWSNYKTGYWMLIEEKCKFAEPSFCQNKLFHIIDKVAKADPNYRGLHLIQFENTSPEDGRICIDNINVSKEHLIRFLQFNEPTNSYIN